MKRILILSIATILIYSAPERARAQAEKVEPTPAPSPTTPEVSLDHDSPTLVIQRYTEELKTIVEPQVSKDKNKRDTSREKRIADKVRQFFDFEGLAKMALGRHWSKINSQQQQEYKELFVSLIEDSYLRRSREIVGDYKIVYGREELKGNRAKVICQVIRNDADVDIVYELHRNPKNWMIYNIVLDSVDLIRNYQTQFNRIIELYGFNEFLARLRRKKDEATKDVSL